MQDMANRFLLFTELNDIFVVAIGFQKAILLKLLLWPLEITTSMR